MAKHLDYICPMIYPSHYGDGNFGIEHPDTQPYDTILAALMEVKAGSGYRDGGGGGPCHRAAVAFRISPPLSAALYQIRPCRGAGSDSGGLRRRIR